MSDMNIWCIARKKWWRPSGCGYTSDRSKAGVYSEEGAKVILESANLVSLNEEAYYVGDENVPRGNGYKW